MNSKSEEIPSIFLLAAKNFRFYLCNKKVSYAQPNFSFFLKQLLNILVKIRMFRFERKFFLKILN